MISAKRYEGMLVLKVCDDGPGMASGTVEGKGVGISTTRARLEKLYGVAQPFELRHAEGGGLDIPG